jgi:hypothetical protein
MEKARLRRTNNRPDPRQRPSPFQQPSPLSSRGLMGLRPANVMKKTSVRQLLSIEPLPFPLSSRVFMGQRPTYEDENGFYLATTLPGSAALPFVISTGAHPDFLPRSPGQDRVCAFL